MTGNRWCQHFEIVLKLVGVVALVGSIAGAQSPVQKAAVTWSPTLKLASRKDIPQRLAQPFGDVFVGTVNGKNTKVANCNEYLSSRGFRAENEQAGRILHNDAVECVALRTLLSAHEPQHRPTADFKLTPATLAILPPELAPAVSDDLIAKAKAADVAGTSWASYLPDAVANSLEQDQLEVKEPGWDSRLTWYASGDFTGGGSEEYLIRVDYQAEGGTYGNSKLFLLAPGHAGVQRLRLIREVKVP